MTTQNQHNDTRFELLTRYEPWCLSQTAKMEKEPFGDWMKRSEVKKFVQHLQSDLAKAKEENDKLKNELSTVRGVNHYLQTQLDKTNNDRYSEFYNGEIGTHRDAIREASKILWEAYVKIRDLREPLMIQSTSKEPCDIKNL